MTDTPLPLPEGLRWIKIVCRLGRLAHDGVDPDDKPDLLPTAGKVRLASSPARLRVQEPDGRWRSVSLDDREYNIRTDGELVDTEGRVGVWIPDPASELLDPRPYMLVATVTPTVGERWAAKITGENLPDVVDLVAHSETVTIPASAVPGLSSRIAALEGILADGGTGTSSGIRNISGAVTLPDDGPRVLEMYTVGPATVNGESFAVDTALVARRTADGVWQVAVVADETWRAFGATVPVEDTTPPSAGTLTVTGSGFVGSTRTLTVSDASDDVALAALPYRFSVDNAATWSDWQASNTWTSAALTEGSYVPSVQVRDAAGNFATASAPAFTVLDEASSWGTVHSDSFDTYAASTVLTGSALEEGGLTWQATWEPTGMPNLTTSPLAGYVATGTGRLNIGQLTRFDLSFDFTPVLFQDQVTFGWNQTTAHLHQSGTALSWSDGYFATIKGGGEFSLDVVTPNADPLVAPVTTRLYTLGGTLSRNVTTTVRITFNAGVLEVWTAGVLRGTYTIEDWAPAPTTPFATFAVTTQGAPTVETRTADNFSLRAA